jgi:D-glycero-alpha-D-manno-heptose 1-phosphate guanylyltransferase
MVSECIILAGGLGTRLRTAVPDLPKVMAPVAGKPFIHHIILYLQSSGIKRFILSLGHMHEVVETYTRSAFPGLDVVFSIESEPLGTGGAIQLAIQHVQGENAIVVNGDTLYKADLPKVSAFHEATNAACTLTLKPMQNFERYGVVEVDERGSVTSFKEKKFYEKGLINGGIYVINKSSLLSLNLPAKFSFEKDYLEQYIHKQKIYGLTDENYFIDIGIPEDFEKANQDL